MIHTDLGELEIVDFAFDEVMFLDFADWITPEEDLDEWEVAFGEYDVWDLQMIPFCGALALGNPSAIALAEILLRHTEGFPLNEIETRLERARQVAA